MSYLYKVLLDRSVLMDLDLGCFGLEDRLLMGTRTGPWLFSELLLDELLASPCSIFCLEGSRELSKLSA